MRSTRGLAIRRTGKCIDEARTGCQDCAVYRWQVFSSRLSFLLRKVSEKMYDTITPEMPIKARDLLYILPIVPNKAVAPLICFR